MTDPDQGTDMQLCTVSVQTDPRGDKLVNRLIQDGNGLLRGIPEDYVFRPLGGPRNLLALMQGGEDTIQFFGKTSNGFVEIDFIVGFGGDDVLDPRQNITQNSNMFLQSTFLAAFALLVASSASADQAISDQYPGSPLYQKPVEVIPHVWSAIGATAPPSYENTGHNNNLSFIV
ncbi:MAG: hypothetical protein AB8B85_18950, partial [Paracoccaceae bacterium]